LKVWSAAAATGQEPYSIAMLLADSFPELANWIVQCTASDLSNEVLEIARQGCYRQSEVERGLPAPMLEKYFRKQGADWRIAEQIRARVDFRRINLVLPWPSLPLMDIVLMRNVLIYMDSETKKDILARVRKLLKPDGYLLLGSTETTINLDPGFEQIQMGKTMCFRLRT
jgi:chemotaxis protein methyltransferase CheR